MENSVDSYIQDAQEQMREYSLLFKRWALSIGTGAGIFLAARVVDAPLLSVESAIVTCGALCVSALEANFEKKNLGAQEKDLLKRWLGIYAVLFMTLLTIETAPTNRQSRMPNESNPHQLVLSAPAPSEVIATVQFTPVPPTIAPTLTPRPTPLPTATIPPIEAAIRSHAASPNDAQQLREVITTEMSARDWWIGTLGFVLGGLAFYGLPSLVEYKRRRESGTDQ